jgi:DNA-binding MarR family transcriptional regulator
MTKTADHTLAAEGPRHLAVLEALEGAGNVSQRTLGERLGMAAGLVNRLLQELVDGRLLEVVDPAVRPFAYRLTLAGQEYLRGLRHDHYQAVLADLHSMRGRIVLRLREIRAEGVERMAFYGAGEILDVALPLAEGVGLEVLAVVDDDPGKQGTERAGVSVRSPTELDGMTPDCVLITTFRHAAEIRQRIDRELGARLAIKEL